MSTLVAITYPSKETAQSALSALGQLQSQELIEIRDAIIATNDGEKVHLDQAVNLAGAGALGGAFWGGLIGLIFLMPVAGMAIGAASGAISGKFSDYGIDDKFAKEMISRVDPGKAALLLMADSGSPERVVEEMKKHNFGGEIIYTNLSSEDEQRLRSAAASA